MKGCMIVNKSSAKRVIAMLCMAVVSYQLLAQSRQIAGTVFDSDGTTSLPGVSISVKGTAQGAITDVNGKYKINISEDKTLIFSYVGYNTKEISTKGKSLLDVILTPKTVVINEVVVTALGIKREEKSLGYSVAKVDNDELTKTMSSNWLNALNGKVAGLNLNSAAAGPMGSLRVTLRGESSIDPSKNEALFVVDGIPIASGMEASGDGTSAFLVNDTPIDYGNGASDLNPEDIESVTVLKGASATALYGSRAANGAIIITTKSGKSTKGIGVSVTSSAAWEQAGYWPDFQTEYGSGAGGNDKYYCYTSTKKDEGFNRTHSTSAWGPRYEGQMFYQYDGKQEDGTYVKTPWVPRDFYKGFFETGVTFKNSVSVEGNNGRGTRGRISFSDTRNSWITPNTGYSSNFLSAYFSTVANKYITLDAKVNYTHRASDNLPSSGYGNSTVMHNLMWGTSTTDISWFKKYWADGKEGVDQNNPFYSDKDSPYFQAYENLNTLNRDRITGSVSVNVKLNKFLTLMLRSGLDNNNELRTQQKGYDSATAPKGKYREQNIWRMELNHDFLLKYDRTFKDFGVGGSFGGNMMIEKKRNQYTTSNQLEIPGIYNFSNSLLAPTLNFYKATKKINSLYGLIQLSYKNWVYVDITGRNDWSSTLAKENNSYFYPSVSASFILSDIFKMKQTVSPVIDLFKARLSWANVGNDTGVYNIDNYYYNSSFTGAVSIPSAISNHSLKPEMVETWEAGIEGKFFRGRLGFDITYYHAISRNQILRTPLDPVTGFSEKVINAGKIRNEGWEITLNGSPVKTHGFTWNSSLTWSRNRNKVLELAPGIDTWIISKGARGQVEARPGGTLGDMYGTGFETAPEGAYITLADGTQQDVSGEVMYDSNGYPILSTKMQYLGNTQVKWKAGFNNTFSYKGIRLSIAFDGQYGGKAYSLTNAILSYSGKLKNSLEGRYDGLVGKGVVYDATSKTYSRNTVVTDNISHYYDLYYQRDNVRNNLFSTSFLKLREVRLDYTLPKSMVSRLKGFQGISVGVWGRNLWMLTDWPQYDPEVATLNGSEITTGFETGQFPYTRSFGVDLKLKF